MFKYITGIVNNHRHKLIAINGTEDHIHIFVGLNPSESISTLMRIVKGESSEWINKRKFVKGRFSWQEGYGAFSYSRSHIDRVYNYVINQKEHHKKKLFLDEYKEMLEKFEIDFDERYIFRPIE